MNSHKKFINFLESIKDSGNSALVEGIQEGFKIIFEEMVPTRDRSMAGGKEAQARLEKMRMQKSLNDISDWGGISDDEYDETIAKLKDYNPEEADFEETMAGGMADENFDAGENSFNQMYDVQDFDSMNIPAMIPKVASGKIPYSQLVAMRHAGVPLLDEFLKKYAKSKEEIPKIIQKLKDIEANKFF